MADKELPDPWTEEAWQQVMDTNPLVRACMMYNSPQYQLSLVQALKMAVVLLSRNQEHMMGTLTDLYWRNPPPQPLIVEDKKCD